MDETNPFNQPTAPQTNPFNVAAPQAPQQPAQPFANTVPGIALNTLTGIPAAALQVAKSIMQGLGRDAVSVGISAAQAPLNLESDVSTEVHKAGIPFAAPENLGREADMSVQPTGLMAKLVGNQPIQGLADTAAGYEGDIAGSDFARKTGISNYAAPLGVLGATGPVGLDFLGAGADSGDTAGAKSLIDFFTKQSDPAVISQALQKMGIHPELIDPFAKFFSQVDDPKDVESGLTALNAAQKVGEVAKASAQGVDSIAANMDPIPPVTEHTFNFAPETKPVEPPITPQSVKEPTIDDVFPESQSSLEGQPQDQTPATPSLEARLALAQQKDIPTSVESLKELNQSRDTADTSSGLTIPDDNTYVKNDELNIQPEGTDKKTAAGIRQAYTELKNTQIVRGNNLADQLKEMTPHEQDGMFWYKAAKGDTATLEGLLENPNFDEYRPGIKQALNLSPQAKEALATGEQYYTEAGRVALQTGSIDDLRENYQNRIYKPEAATDFVKNESRQGLKPTTSHGKARIFNSEIDAVNAGKRFATTNYADALAIHNEEMARVNTARKALDTMEKGGLGAWTDRMPSNWSQVGTMRKGAQVFAAPNGIAKGMRAITDPDFMAKIDAIRGIRKYQGLVKSVDLAMSFYHHLTFVTQALSSRGGVGTLAHMVAGGLKMASPAFKEMELDFVNHGGITSQVAATQDIMSHLTEGNDMVSKALRLPVLKQATQAIEASNDFLFGKIQRFLKTMTFQKEAAAWVNGHPNATNAEVTAAKRGYAKAVNANFGGLNWEAMGITKSDQSLLRTLFLAPDWLTSAGSQVKYALSDTGTAGNAARATMVKAIVGGMAVTEGLNKLITGHYTDQNPKGHTLELEVAPNVYVSLIRGAPGELVKLLSNVTESGPIEGTSRYLQSKLAAIPRTALGLVSGVNYVGQNIYTAGQKHPNAVSETFGGLLFALENGSPFPFGLGNTASYVGSGTATIPGTAAVASGVGRYSVPNKKAAAAQASAKALNPFNQ